ncbi:MAG: Flp pilus assembly protein CpaB [Candidatus Omnitrophica bacterium]|nr:Flp pilus assembly protein CpaB [Candidatus Omnitrophota bacterium]
MQKKIPLIIGIALAAVSILLINVYMGQQKQQVVDKTGTAINPEALGVALVPNEYVQPRAATSLDRVAGMVAVAPIAKGEQISLDKLAFSRQRGGSGLAELTPIGKRAVTISVENTAALAGMIKPGDYVDVIAMVPIPVQTADGKQTTQVMATPLFQNILVLAVGQQLAQSSKAGENRYVAETKADTSISPLITLAVSPQEASLITFVQEQSKIRLTLRSPSDSQLQQVQPATWETIFQYIMPKETSKPEPTVKEPEPGQQIEIYRGLNKEKILLSK